MEHIIETILPNGYTRLTPEAGWSLVDARTNTSHSEAIVAEKSKAYFTAVKVAEPTDEDIISDAEALKIITGK